MTLPIATETIVTMYRDQRMTEQQIASQLGCSQQMVGYRLRKAGVSQRRTNKRHLYGMLKPHLPVLLSMIVDMRKRRKLMAEYIVDPRNPSHDRDRMSERLVTINREIAALEIVVMK